MMEEYGFCVDFVGGLGDRSFLLVFVLILLWPCTVFLVVLCWFCTVASLLLLVLLACVAFLGVLLWLSVSVFGGFFLIKCRFKKKKGLLLC